MTYDEAVNCLTFYMAGWPSQEKMSNEAAALWIHDLEALDHATAIRALDRLRHTDDYPPSLHKFLGAYQALAPRSYHEAIGPGARDTKTSAPIVAALREGLKHVSKAEHANHHKAPHLDCPVCSQHDHEYRSGRWVHLESCKRCYTLGQDIYDGFKEGRSA